MKAATDKTTIELDLPGAKRARGRPPTFAAKSNAERQKAYRDKQRAAGKEKSNDKVTEIDAVDLHNMMARSSIDDGLIAELQEKLAHIERENDLLVKERANAWAVIDKLRADLANAAKPAETGLDWKQRALALTHELDVNKLLLAETKRAVDLVEEANKTLRATVTKISAKEKREKTAAVKTKDLETRNAWLQSQVDHLSSELKRHAKL